MSEDRTDEIDIIAKARRSDDFRQVVMTGEHMQIVTMTLAPGEEIGAETHEGHDQVLFFVDGAGEAVLDGKRSTVTNGDLVFVYAGVLHNFINTGSEPLRLVTAYAPPEHEHGTRHATKAEAEAGHDH
jgi:mannose-6-phosphate isomerase-like protein (cupin superfamily)